MDEKLTKLVLSVPETSIGIVLGELNHCGGWIDGMKNENGVCTVEARAPVQQIESYKRWLQEYTNGKGTLVVI
ncbi:MAG TPA: hypothetical protein VLB06_08120 [Sulfuricaulis sp.]|nr:hypothetical protein [Sulfuricaulis sp.]